MCAMECFMANDRISRRAMLGGAAGMAGLMALPAWSQEGSTEFQARVEQRTEQHGQLSDAAMAGLF